MTATSIPTDVQPEQSPPGTPPSRVASGAPAERFRSRNPDDFATPTGREENWRFTPVRRLRPFFAPATSEHTIDHRVEAPDGARVTTVGTDHPLFGAALTPGDRVSALAAANVGEALLISLGDDVRLTEPVVVQLSGRPGFNYGHVIVDAGRFSSGTVVLDHVGDTSLAANVEVVVAEGASLTLVSIQDWDAPALHLASHGALVGRDARFKHVSVTLGGSIVRLAPSVEFGGPGGSAELYGLSFATAGQHLESRLYVDHAVPNCTSHVVYKSALDGDTARTVWIGDVRIRPPAVGTSTYELNRNLLLTEGARADSVPNLEIETGEIAGAGHASATGRFDDQQMFYLQARGIPEAEARRLVVRGFFADILDRIPVPELRERLIAAVDLRLAHQGAGEAAHKRGSAT